MVQRKLGPGNIDGNKYLVAMDNNRKTPTPQLKMQTPQEWVYLKGTRGKFLTYITSLLYLWQHFSEWSVFEN